MTVRLRFMRSPSRLVSGWSAPARDSDGTARFGGRVAWLAGVFTLFLILAVCVQVKSGALNRDSEAAHYPDEPAHVVTSLLVHDYVAAFFPGPPLSFAETYYLHYPKVAFGMWPPVFHIFAALWMLIFGASKNALLLFVAFEGALLATALFGLARSLIHPLAAAGLGVLLLLNPLAQYCMTLVMLDTQVALLDLLTVLALTRFFRTRRTRDGVFFGALTVVAMLTKGNACALVLMPPILILIRRDWRVLRSAGLYIAAGIILMLGVPWQLLSWKLLTASVPIAHFGAAYMFRNLTVYSHDLLANVGVPVLLVSAAGFAISLKRAAGPSDASDGALAMAAACTLFLAVMLFQCIAPVPVDQRYMLPVIAPILFFFAAGVSAAGSLIPVPGGIAGWLLATSCVALFLTRTFSIPSRPPLGYSHAADLIRGVEPSGGVSLICSDSDGEGALVEEIALGDRRPDRFVLRGSKVLSENEWDVTVYRPFFSSPDALAAYLDSVPVDTVLVDRSEPMWKADRDLLLSVMWAAPDKWKLVADIPHSRASRHLLLFSRAQGHPKGAGSPNIHLNMKFTLGRKLSLH